MHVAFVDFANSVNSAHSADALMLLMRWWCWHSDFVATPPPSIIFHILEKTGLTPKSSKWRRWQNLYQKVKVKVKTYRPTIWVGPFKKYPVDICRLKFVDTYNIFVNCKLFSNRQWPVRLQYSSASASSREWRPQAELSHNDLAKRQIRVVFRKYLVSTLNLQEYIICGIYVPHIPIIKVMRNNLHKIPFSFLKL